jgi:ribosomal protein S18 acetylase RimI-like enzyme
MRPFQLRRVVGSGSPLLEWLRAEAGASRCRYAARAAGPGALGRGATVAGLSDSPRATGVVIRAARLEDVRRVLALWDQSRRPAAVTPDDVRSVSQLIAHTEDALLVAEHEGEIVGALIAAWDGWRGNMYRLAVLPHLRRQGVAKRLVEAGHEHLRGKGAARVTALVAHEEEDAVRLWESAGYHRDAQIARFVKNL